MRALRLALALGLASGPAAKAQSVPEPVPGLAVVGRAHISATYGAEIHPPYVYVLDRGLLRVLDASDPGAIHEVGSLEARPPRTRMWLRPPYLYLTGFGEALGVVDVSDPSAPRWAGEFSDFIPAPGKGFRMAGDRAFLVRMENAAEAVSPVHPRSPWSGRLVLDVLDLATTPPEPRRLGSVDLGVSARGEYGAIAHQGERVYVLVARPAEESSRSQIVVVDVSDPANPRIERRLRLPEGKQYRNVEVRGDLLYLLQFGRQEARENGLAIYRMRPDRDPEFLGEATHSSLRYSVDLIVRGDAVYATFKGAPTFATFDVSNPRRPRMVHSYVENENWAGGLGLALAGDHLFVTGDNGPSALFDVSVPDAPRLLGRWDNQGGYVKQVVRSGSVAVVVNMTDLLFYDVSNPREPRRVGRHEGVPLYWTGGIDQWSIMVGVSGSRAVVAYESIPAEVIDFSDPTRPSVLGRFEPRGLVHAVALTPTHAFLGYRAPAVGRVPRMSDPSSLSERGGVEILDLRDPSKPQRTMELSFGAAVTDLAVAGERLAVAHQDGSFTLVDVQDPARPLLLGRLVGSGSNTSHDPLRTARVALSADGLRAYLAHSPVSPDGDPYVDGEGILTAVDLSDPARPRAASHVRFERRGGMEIPVAAHGYRVAVLMGPEGGVLVVDAKKLTRPVIIAREPLPVRTYVEGLTTDGQHVYVGAWEDGMLVLELPTSTPQ